MRNLLQDQLLKAGLVKKAKVAQVVREQTKQRHGKAPAEPLPDQIDAQKLQAERAQRDRALAAERNAQAKIHEQRAQARQIIEAKKIANEGDIAYRFNDGELIRSILVTRTTRGELAQGSLVIVRHDEGYALVPRLAAEKITERDSDLIVLDHGKSEPGIQAEGGDDEYYKQFEVPDDLIW